MITELAYELSSPFHQFNVCRFICFIHAISSTAAIEPYTLSVAFCACTVDAIQAKKERKDDY